jgi:hypothetical protein
MAITSTTVFGDLRVQIGTYTSSSTTASIATGFTAIFYAALTTQSAAATVPLVSWSAGTITGTTASNDTGYYIAIGK